MHRRATNIIKHLTVWLIYVSFAILVYGYEVNLKGAIYETAVAYAISASVFYLNCGVLLPRYFERRRYILFALLLVMSIAYNFAIRYTFAFYIDPLLFGRPSSIEGLSLIKLGLLFTWQWATFMLYSTGYWFAAKQIRLQKEARAREQVKAAYEKLQLENAALRAQINPHFFVNTMNSFKVAVEPVLPQTAEGIEAMMIFMKSSIAPTEQDGTIALSEEVAAIESLITIYKARFPNANIRYEKDIRSGVRIVPHVLAAFVENAFKHGSFTHKEKKLSIEIMLEGNDLFFRVHNWKSRRIKDDSRGIGLKYIKRQLETAFHGRYQLTVNETEQDYTVALTINDIARTHEKYKLLYS